MTTLSFTTYVDASTAEVVDRISAVSSSAPAGAIIDVLPFVDRSKIVIHMPWNADSDAERSGTTLAATRLVRALDLALVAA